MTKKTVAIIGANGLLGKEISPYLEKQNWNVFLGDILEQSDKNYFQVDITSKKSLEEFIDQGEKVFGQLDAVINLAYPRNKNYGRHFFDVEYADFCENVSLHLGGSFLVMQVFAKYFKDKNNGTILNFSSIYGVKAPDFSLYNNTEMTMPVEYAAIKSSIIHLTKYTAKYLKGSNVRVNTLSPGGFLDNQKESFVEQYNNSCLSKGMLDASDVLGTVKFLISDESKFINGQNIILDDGFTL